MILDKEGKWLFVSTMKCATNTMYDVLPGEALWNMTGQFHGRPARRLAKTHWTIVRNPYDRAVSIWASTCLREGDRYGAKEKVRKYGGIPEYFEDFCRACLYRPTESSDGNKWLFRNQFDWISTFLCDRLAKFENIPGSIERIVGDLPDLPVKNKSEHQHWHNYMTPLSAMIIEQWAPKDFKFGYEKLNVEFFEDD